MRCGSFIALFFAFGIVTGCYEGAEFSPPGETQFRKVQTSFNATVNATQFGVPTLQFVVKNAKLLSPFKNGVYFLKTCTGAFCNGTRLDGVTINGQEALELDINGSVLEVTIEGEKKKKKNKNKKKETVLSGAELIGAVLHVRFVSEDEEGNAVEAPIDIRVDDFYNDPAAFYDDVFAYDLVYRQVGEDADWRPICADEYDNVYPAIILRNSWNIETGERIDADGVMTIACTTGVLAHCAEWGYRPWASGQICDEKQGKKGKKGKKGKNCEEVSLADYHQTCTRMARADYCGDGVSWTVDGTALDIWDDLSPQIQGRFLDWKIEAEWTPDGALCIDDIRQQQWKEDGIYPPCADELKLDDCGSLQDHRAMIASSFNPDGT